MSRFAQFVERNRMLTTEHDVKTTIPHAHPYFPTAAVIPGYTPNELPLLGILGGFSAGCIVLFAITALVVTRIKPGIPLSALGTVIWFVLCGSLHVFFEGYFVTHPTTLAGSQHFFAQMWKEYAQSDSRYLIGGSFITCVEGLTVVIWGPLSFVTAYLVTMSSPYEAVAVMIVSVGHLYSNLLYYSTALYEELVLHQPFSRPEPYYFWVYFIGMNAFWIVIPAVLLVSRIQMCARAMAALRILEKEQEAKGTAKKST